MIVETRERKVKDEKIEGQLNNQLPMRIVRGNPLYGECMTRTGLITVTITGSVPEQFQRSILKSLSVSITNLTPHEIRFYVHAI